MAVVHIYYCARGLARACVRMASLMFACNACRVFSDGAGWSVCFAAVARFRLGERQVSARLAQSVEHGTLNPRVVGSSPTLGE